MQSEPSFVQKARYYSSVTGVYLLTLLFAWQVFSPAFISKPPKVEALKSLPLKTEPAPIKIIAGLPLRIVVPTLGLDLPIDKGEYNQTTNSWTLSGYHAQFATMTALANDHQGNTFIYGHNNKYVFGRLRLLNPGDPIVIYTDNNLVFHYRYDSAVNVGPDDTSVLSYQGPPILTIQTCSGNWNEWRRMYKFTFEKVE